jgi:molybdopterin converting factor small subunit
MEIDVHFFSYFKELTGCAQTRQTLPVGATIHDLLHQLHARFPRLEPLERSTLVAVGLEYQPRDHALREGDEVSLFPPVQGG